MNIQEELRKLGFKAKDRVTGFQGVISSIGFDLYGCVQAIVTPEVNKKDPEKIGESRWFDIGRLVLLGNGPVMEQPNFVEVKGPAEKPANARL